MPCDNSRGGAFIGGSKWEKGGRERGNGPLGTGVEGGHHHPRPSEVLSPETVCCLCGQLQIVLSLAIFRLCSRLHLIFIVPLCSGPK